MDCILNSFMDTLTLLIVDFVGELAHQSEEAQSWQKNHCERVETLHLQPTQMLDNDHRQRKGWLCALVLCYESYMYLYFNIE